MIRSKFKRQIFSEAALTSHLIYQIGEIDSLREQSKDVIPADIKSVKIKSIISKLKRTLKEYKKLTGKGRGVAAIQIGQALKIAVIFNGHKILTLINPKIIKKSKELLRYPEICMSANPIIAKVARPSWIEVEYLDENGNKKFWNDNDNKTMNRVLQHEIDHMNGIINIDMVKSEELILNSDPKFFKNARFEKIQQNKAREGPNSKL